MKITIERVEVETDTFDALDFIGDHPNHFDDMDVDHEEIALIVADWNRSNEEYRKLCNIKPKHKESYTAGLLSVREMLESRLAKLNLPGVIR